jgi:hypothetical protein
MIFIPPLCVASPLCWFPWFRAVTPFTTTLKLWLACLTAVLTVPALHAEPLLRCELTYAGSTQTLQTAPVADPYPVQSVDVGGRFRFKAVVVGAAAQVDYIKLYAYLDGRRQPVLVQQATYLPPFAKGSSLTGRQFVYAGPVERELQYECTLQEVAP